MTALTAGHERFRRWSVELDAAAGAARAAGCSAKGANMAGYRLRRHPRVPRRIAEIAAETARPRGDAVPIGKPESVHRRAIADRRFPAPFVNFCNGGKSSDFNAILETRVYFCIPGRKGHSR